MTHRKKHIWNGMINPCDDSALLEALVCKNEIHRDAVREFYAHSVESCQIERGLRVFRQLESRFQDDREIFNLYTALCITAGNYDHAMSRIQFLIGTCKPDDALVDAALGVVARMAQKAESKSVPKGPSISLCMIVKDEMAGLGACLNSAKKVVDEIIVVDTGSRDRTKDIARIFGAKVFQYSWKNDFSAARNFSLQQATKDWILILDADEIIAARDQRTIREMILDPSADESAFTLVTRNYTYLTNRIGWHVNDNSYGETEAGLGWFPTRKVRLFPRRSDIRFSFPVHERVDPSVRAAGIRIVDCPVPVHHYGDLNQEKKLQKTRGYFQMGYSKLNQFGQDLEALRELAVQAGELEEWMESIKLWRMLLKYRPDFVEAHINVASAKWNLEQYDEALSAAQRAMEIDPVSREAKYNAAVSLLMLKKTTEALMLLLPLVKAHPDYFPSQFMLAVAFICKGQRAQCDELLSRIKDSKAGDAVPLAAREIEKRLINIGLKDAAGNFMQAVCVVYKNHNASRRLQHSSAMENHEQPVVEVTSRGDNPKNNMPCESSAENQSINSTSVCVTGMHRSGTSMVTRLLKLCGLYLGPDQKMIPAHSDNPNGFWEHLDIVLLNEKLLQILGGAWDFVPKALPGWESDQNLNPIKEAVQQIIGGLGQVPFWGWKDPRNSLTIAFWRKILPELKVLICLRNPVEVAISLQKRNGLSIIFGLNLWYEYNNALMAAIKPEDRLITHYEAYFKNPERELRRVLNWIGLCADNPQIEGAISTVNFELRHNVCAKVSNIVFPNSREMNYLYGKMCIEAGMDHGDINTVID